ncbi:protein of unknown function [Streptomyces sp. 2131.1]|uniref:DUF397 domain-containing protein n=1 Tax=Streptomyces sp. 2131.1 TaxID=1855346 RepID=UPI00089CA6A0|nr:DUF397 domain-containing protein [Streptomyces sp. 2131.1]SEE84877.1 protein of unknown function [Streptomyces sp. 2131.1]
MNRIRKSTDLAPEKAWFKSSYSSGAEGNCVEAADLEAVANVAAVGVRDSKDKTGPALHFPKTSWSTFVTRVREGVLDPRA